MDQIIICGHMKTIRVRATPEGVVFEILNANLQYDQLYPTLTCFSEEDARKLLPYIVDIYKLGKADERASIIKQLSH